MDQEMKEAADILIDLCKQGLDRAMKYGSLLRERKLSYLLMLDAKEMVLPLVSARLDEIITLACQLTAFGCSLTQVRTEIENKSSFDEEDMAIFKEAITKVQLELVTFGDAIITMGNEIMTVRYGDDPQPTH